MSDLKRHHYVGTNKGGRLVCDRHAPRHTVNLYTIEAFAEADRQVVEKVVMNKMVGSAPLRNSNAQYHKRSIYHAGMILPR